MGTETEEILTYYFSFQTMSPGEWLLSKQNYETRESPGITAMVTRH